MVKFIVGVAVLFISCTTFSIESWKEDPSETDIGIHLLENYGKKYSLLSKDISMESVTRELFKLNWNNNFYQFSVVTRKGVSMEVGGSLNGIDGLSAMYRNRDSRLEAVIVDPPSTVLEMEEILRSFLSTNEKWHQKYDFKFSGY